MFQIRKRDIPVDYEGKIQRLEAENAELKSRTDELEDALVEIAELIEGEPEPEPEPESEPESEPVQEGGNE